MRIQILKFRSDDIVSCNGLLLNQIAQDLLAIDDLPELNQDLLFELK